MTQLITSETIITACKSYQPLTDFMTTTFNKPLKYFDGLRLDIDHHSYHDYAYLPALTIDPESETSDKNNIQMGMILHVKIFHEDEFKKNAIPEVDDVISLVGLKEVRTLCGLIVEALKDVDVNTDNIDIFIDPVEYVSNRTEYDGHIVITYSKDYSIGCNL